MGKFDQRIGFLGVGGIALLLAVATALSAQTDPAGAESAVDAAAFQANCASCHGPTLGGSSGPAVGPALRGQAFVAKWGKEPSGRFLAFVHRAMPLNAPGTLDEATSARAANFVLAQNGLPVGKVSGDKAAVSSEYFAPPPDAEDQDPTYKAALAARAEQLGRLRPVVDAQLAAPDGVDWLSWRGGSATLGYSPAAQINRSNVGGLGLAWSLSLEPGTGSIAPLVHDGVMFIHSSGRVQAIDASKGEVLWQFERPEVGQRIPTGQTRSLALYGDAVYVSTVDNHVLALAAKTGKLLWDHEIAPPSARFQLTAAPLPVRGKIIQGVSGCHDAAGGCYIVALDAATGKELWRFNTIARPGEPGGDSWNGAPLDKRYGGSVWETGSYDPELGLVYFAVAQTYQTAPLLVDQGRKGESTDALYTDSTVALDPDTGKLVWFYQHLPGDVWDLDWAFEQTLITTDGSHGPRKIVLSGGKMGIFDALDAKTGRYLWSFDLGLQNLVTAIDPATGRKTIDTRLLPEPDKVKLVCPSAIGARNWMSTAYDRDTGLLYIPVMPTTCMDSSRVEGPNGLMGDIGAAKHRRPGGGDDHGWVAALDVASHKLAWTVKRRAPESSAVLATAGGLIFEGARDRYLRASDSRTGETLWQSRLPNTPDAFPVTYSADGVQYVAVVTGGGTPVDMFQTVMAPEYPRSSAARTIMVYALPRPASK